MVTTKGCHPFRCTLEKWSTLPLSTKVFRCSERKRKYNQFNKMAQFMAKLFHFDSFSFNFWPIPWTLAVHFVRNALPHSPYRLVRAAIMVTAPHLDPFDRNPWLISGMCHERGGSQRFPNSWERNATFRFLITSSMIWVLKDFLSRVHCSPREWNFEEFQPYTLPWPTDKYFFLKHLLKCRGYLGF